MSRVVVITGVCGGLGSALAKKFTENGDVVFGLDIRKDKQALKAFGSKRSRLLTGDLTSEKKVKSMLARVRKRTGRIDILINCAGYCGPLTRVEDISLKDFRKHMQSNLLSVFLTCKAALPAMLKQKQALIINVSSMAGTRAVPRLFPYSAAKSGVLALSQCVAKENPDTGLKCITVCPGGMNTKMRRDLFGAEDAERQQSPDFVAYVIDQIVQGRIEVQSGGHIIIRYGKITGVFPPPAA